MRIGIDTRLWNESGVGRYLRNLVTQLAVIDKENEYVLFFKQQEYNTVKLPGPNFSKICANIHWHSIAEQIQFPQILYKAQLDVMHFPYFSLPYFYKKPFVVTIHDVILHHFATGKASTRWPLTYATKMIGYRFLMQYAATHAKKIIAVSKATQAEIIDHLHVSLEKIAVIYEGIEKIAKGDKSILHVFPSDTPYFLYVGNAYPHKNLERLLLALSNVVKEHPHIRLVLVGKQDFFYNRLAKTIQRLDLVRHITHLHHVSDEQLAVLYQHAAAVVVPSLMEGFGLPVVEAMGEGALVIASDIPSLREVSGGHVLFIDPYNISDMTKRLVSVISQGNSYVAVKAAGEKYAQSFSWETMAKETKAIYESCISV